MIFNRAISRNLFKKNGTFRGRRFTSGSAGKTEEAAGGGEESAFAIAAMGTTFATYMLADFLSNFIQHPTQKMDYGYLNSFIGREVAQNWWGTRTEHIVGVAGCLALTDHTSQHFFGKYLGRPLCFAKSPATFVGHTFLFIFGGVAIYCAGDAALNPLHEKGTRGSELSSGLYSTYIGTCTAWFEPYVAPALAKVAGAGVANTWAGSALLPATLAYSTVKGVGWYDWGNSGLNDHEMMLNGLSEKKE